jgi:uncharacterized membrane protein
MNKTKFAVTTAGALCIGVIVYFIVEGISLSKKKKDAKTLDSSITELENTKTLVVVGEEKEIVEESLNHELKKKEEISENIKKSKSRIATAVDATFNILPAVLRFLGMIILSDSPQKKRYVVLESD